MRCSCAAGWSRSAISSTAPASRWSLAARCSTWHVELPRHDLILAEGLATESYLDTGNRPAFAGGRCVELHPDFANGVWRREGCAPLLLRGPRLQAERRRLLARAIAHGHAITDDPGICISADGRVLAMVRQGACIRARLPAGASRVRLRSRTWTPAHTDQVSEDARVLGVAIGRLWLDGRQADLASPALDAGWHPAEPGFRWTDGDATLALACVREIAFEIVMTGRYWAIPAASAQRTHPRATAP